MVSNFDFLKDINSDLYGYGKDAELMQASNMKQGVPNICRQFLECLIYDLCDKMHKDVIMSENSRSKIIDLFSTIKIIKKEINEKVGFKIDNLRIICNRGSHYQAYLEDELTDGEVAQIINDIHYVSRWYAKTYYNVGSESYDINVIEPITATKTELVKLREMYKNKIEECEEWKQDYEDSEKKINELTKKLNSSISKSVKTKDNNEADKLKKQNALLQDEMFKIKDNFIKMKNQFNKAEEKNKYLVQKHNEVVIAYNKQNEDIKTKNKTIEILKQKIETLSKENKTKEQPVVIHKQYSKEENYNRFLEKMKNRKFGGVKYNELAFDVLAILVKLDRMEINFITQRQIYSFFIGENTRQISLFKLHEEDMFGKYKDEDKPNFNRKISQILKIWTDLKAISNPRGLIDVLI